jgi:hypothetical protein
VPIERYPEPLQSALLLATEREWAARRAAGNDEPTEWLASPYLARLLTLAGEWAQRYQRQC